MRMSVIGILGIGGPELSSVHAEETGRAVSAMDPDYLSMLTLMLVPGTELHRQWLGGALELLDPEAMLLELRRAIRHLNGLSHCVFRTNRASNFLLLAGTLPQDKKQLLTTLDAALALGRPALRPDAWRRL